MANYRYPGKGTCYIAACKNSATTWIERSEFEGGKTRTVEAKVCTAHARSYKRAADQSG